MNGVLFLWLAWLIIIYAYFLMDHSKKRTFTLVFSLSTIILSLWSYTFFSIEWNLAFVPFLFLCIDSMTKLNRNQLIVGFIISIFIAYWFWLIHNAIYLEPVWLLLSPISMILGVSIPLLIIIIRNLYTRIFSLIIGFFQGITLTSLLVTVELGMTAEALHNISGMFLLDVISLALIIILFWSRLEMFAQKIKEKIIATNQPISKKQTNMNV
ncbi:hypothetical protein ACM26V_01485 [Salipaludibacillus sp. HK11]|uniref:YphA family membrane protein n=1 Tax=Salipaludibacillus sp. HK11 TaxID=3394320 RepID=UPI0039FBC505